MFSPVVERSFGQREGQGAWSGLVAGMGRRENDGCRRSARNQWGLWGSLQQPVGWMLICRPQVSSQLTTHYVKVQFLLHIWKFPSRASSSVARYSKSGVWSGHTSLTLWFVRKAKSWLNPGPTGSESALQQVPQVICRAYASICQHMPQHMLRPVASSQVSATNKTWCPRPRPRESDQLVEDGAGEF